MAITWTEDLETGILEIDKQHQELFKHIDRLLEACKHGAGRDKVQEVVKFLEGYVVFHFGSEEKLMDQYNYPQTKEHKQAHAWFVDQWQGFKKAA